MQEKNIDPAAPGTDKSVVTISYSPREILQLADEAKGLVFKPEAEDALLKLIELATAASQAIELVKAEIERQGLEYDVNFTSVEGDRVKVTYQFSGSVYSVDHEKIKQHKEPFFTKKPQDYKINTAAIAEYEKKHKGKLPLGITRVERKRGIQMKLKKAEV